MWEPRAVLAAIGLVGCGFHGGGGGAVDGMPGGDGGSGGSGSGMPDDAMPASGVPATGCGALAAAQGAQVVTTVTELRAAVAGASANAVIALASGTYDLGTTTLTIATPGIALRSQSGNAADVTLTGDSGTVAIAITASAVTIAAITITGASNAIHVRPAASTGTTGAYIYAVHLADNKTGVQINSTAIAATGPYADAGTIACSAFEASDDAHACAMAVGGVDGAAARDWTVRDTRFANLSCTTGFLRTLRFARGSRGTHVFGNTFVNGSGNVMFGGDFTPGDLLRDYTDPPPICVAPTEHRDGLACNNVITGLDTRGGAQPFQEGIALWNTCGDTIAHNTVVAPPGGMTFSTIEYRYASTQVHLVNNLVPTTPKSRDGGTATLDGNVVYADPAAEFVDPRTDLHVAATAPASDGVALTFVPAECQADKDGRARNATTPTAGAYEE